MTRPLLSVIVPTRERGDVLAELLPCLLSLSLREVEFIICDNASEDHTGQVVEAYADPRVKYARSERRLSMPENFERGLLMAEGDYIMTLGDDDFIIEENLTLALDRMRQDGLDAIYWFRGCFYWGKYPDPALAGCFNIPLGRGQYPVVPATLLHLNYSGQINYQYLPSIYNSVVSRSFLKRYKDHLRGCYFPPYAISVDVFSAVVFCSMNPSVLFQQSPVSVSGISHHSTGMSVLNNSQAHEKALKELGLPAGHELMPDEYRPFVTPLTGTGIAALSMTNVYFNAAQNVLNYTCQPPVDLELHTTNLVRRLLQEGHIRVAEDTDFFRKHVLEQEGEPIVQDDAITYFYRLWCIPLQAYGARFDAPEVTVRHMVGHLNSIGFNKAPAPEAG